MRCAALLLLWFCHPALAFVPTMGQPQANIVNGQGWEQIVGSNGRSPTALFTPTANQIRLDCTQTVVLGGQPTNYVRLGFANYRLIGSGAETSTGNAYTIEAAVELPGAPDPGPKRASFAGITTASVADGAAVSLSDPLYASPFGYADFPAGSQLLVHYSVLTSASAPYPYLASYTNGASEGCVTSASPTSQVLNGGKVSGGTAFTGMGPLVGTVGQFTAPEVSLYFIGDSICRGRNDPLGSGLNGTSGGIFVRAAWNVAGRNIPWASGCGDGAIASAISGSFAKRLAMATYATHVIVQPGTNDIQQGATPATVLGFDQTMWAAFAPNSIKVYQFYLLGWTASTDSWATLVNQTPDPSFVAAGNADTLNASFLANVGSNGLSAVINLRPSLLDLVQTDRWAVTGAANWNTTDGVHPSGTNGFTAGAAALVTVYATFVGGRP